MLRGDEPLRTLWWAPHHAGADPTSAPAFVARRCPRSSVPAAAGVRSPNNQNRTRLSQCPGMARVEINLRHAEAPIDALALDNYVDRDLEKLLNIIPIEVPAAL